MEGQMDEQMDGQMDRHMEGQMHGQMDGQSDSYITPKNYTIMINTLIVSPIATDKRTA